MTEVAPTPLPCPNCKVDLGKMDRDGIEVNFCPDCRGVWVDRFELNKIIERGLDAQMEQMRQPKRKS
jgi:uncharacterized protein